MAVPWNVSNAYVQRDLHCCRHLLHCHHLRPKFEGDLLRDLPGAEAVHHDRGGEEHHGDPRGSEVQLVLVRGVVPQQGGQPMQQGKLTHFRKQQFCGDFGFLVPESLGLLEKASKEHAVSVRLVSYSAVLQWSAFIVLCFNTL